MTEFKLSAPMALPDDVMPTSFFENLAAALGKMSGGMIADGTRLDIGNDGMSLMTVQALISEGGGDAIVMGACPDLDSESAFIAMSDGSIWRLFVKIDGGNCVAWMRKPTEEEVGDNVASLPLYHGIIKAAATEKLRALGLVEMGDSVLGHIETNAHAAICMRACGHGRFVVNVGESASVRGGFDWKVDCPRPNATFDEIVGSTQVFAVGSEEIKEEQDNNKKALGVSTPFPVKIGEA